MLDFPSLNRHRTPGSVYFLDLVLASLDTLCGIAPRAIEFVAARSTPSRKSCRSLSVVGLLCPPEGLSVIFCRSSSAAAL